MKKKIKNFLKIGILTLGFSLVLTNCEKETIPELQQNNNNTEIVETTNQSDNLINAAKSWFEQNTSINSFAILDFAKPLDWNSAIISYENDTYAIEIPIELKDHIGVSINKDKTILTFNRLLFLPSKDSTVPFKSFIVNFFDDNNDIKTFNSHSSNLNYFRVHPSFKGKITLLDSENKVVQIKKIPFSTSDNNTNLFARLDMKAGCTYLGWWYEDGSFEPIWEMYCTGDGGGSGTNSGCQGCSEYTYGGGSGGTTNSNSEVDCNIISSLNFDCGELLAFEQDYKSRMSASELAIFNSISRIKQLSYLANAQNATWKSEELFPNSLYNGKGDAFRHAYWNALNVVDLGDVLANNLATAHEYKPSSYTYGYKEVDMDLYNNQVGRDSWNFALDGFVSVESSILNALYTGELVYLNNLAPNGQATSNSALTPSNQ